MSDDKKKTISGFSKLSKTGKIKWIVENFFKDPETVMRELMSYWHTSEEQQKVLDGFSENTISNFPMPYGVAPNFLINDQTYVIPMVIEESSVVAAASSAAKFWMSRGGFKTRIIGTTKVGQVHFKWKGDLERLEQIKEELESRLLEDAEDITRNMKKRGGGIESFEWLHMPEIDPDYFQLRASFQTCDSMGANFINSCLESFAKTLEKFVTQQSDWKEKYRDIVIIMCILSNYTPTCLVEASVECPVEDLGTFAGDIDAQTFADQFKMALDIAYHDPYRATTHNKGIYNGIDAVVLATGNDFRAVEACGHAYASKDGQYRSLSFAEIKEGRFRFWIKVPLAVGTIGGLTALHPIAKRSLELLGDPDARELMQIIAAVGLAQNFAAVRSLITTGIQKGHMKMHLQNILIQLGATEKETKKVERHFEEKVVSFSAVREYLEAIRNEKGIFTKT
ncbi:MAG: hydroxymethylglutaryl-CoA reductase [Saprospiraceae bacterium]|nr:hydroxymethylglutaryl-CoA reductase [Saprospiraceae bacterium]